MLSSPVTGTVRWLQRIEKLTEWRVCVCMCVCARDGDEMATGVVGRMMGQPSDESLETASPTLRHWMLNFIILLCGLFFVLTYEATMT